MSWPELAVTTYVNTISWLFFFYSALVKHLNGVGAGLPMLFLVSGILVTFSGHI